MTGADFAKAVCASTWLKIAKGGLSYTCRQPPSTYGDVMLNPAALAVS
jgi:hypothetical protein